VSTHLAILALAFAAAALLDRVRHLVPRQGTQEPRG